MQQIVEHDNPCGGVDMFVIVPKVVTFDQKKQAESKLNHVAVAEASGKSEKKTKPHRLHLYAHYEFGLENRRAVSSFTPVHSWGEIWEHCQGWSGDLPAKFCGKVQRGIVEWNGNECFAFVEHKARIYFVSGVWG